jgi:hypothetical protein
MAFGAASVAFAKSPQVIILDPPPETAYTFDTDKDRYAWGDTITFTIEVTNVSEDVLYNVRVAPDPRHPQWFTVVTSEEDCVIGTLQPAETAGVQIVIGTQTLSVMDRFSVFKTVLLDRLLDACMYAYSTALKVNYPGIRYRSVRVGGLDQDVNFNVYCTNVKPEE